jgi:hypothetical protein
MVEFLQLYGRGDAQMPQKILENPYRPRPAGGTVAGTGFAVARQGAPRRLRSDSIDGSDAVEELVGRDEIREAQRFLPA